MAASSGSKEKIVFTGGISAKHKAVAKELSEGWVEAERVCEAAMGKARSKCGDQKDDILARGERMGIPRAVLKEAMKKAKHIRKADECGRDFEDAVLRVFENLELALELPLFDAAGVEAAPAKKPKRPAADADDGDGKGKIDQVADMAARAGATGAGAAAPH